MLQDLAVLFVRELDALQREIELYPSDEAVWRALPGTLTFPANGRSNSINIQFTRISQPVLINHVHSYLPSYKVPANHK